MILLHINDNTKRQQILSLCHSLNHQVKLFDENDVETTVGELTGVKQSKGKEPENDINSGSSIGRQNKVDVNNHGRGGTFLSHSKEGHLPDCIIFSDISNLEMDIFLAEYKKRGIEPTPMKAIVTVYNMDWSIDKLIEELKREQIAIIMRGR